MDAKFERPPGLDIDARAMVARHEAAHAVSMLRLGLGVREVVVNDDNTGYVKPVRNPIGLKSLVTFAAGHAADRRCCPDMIRSSISDASEVELRADLLSMSKRGRRLLVKWAQHEAEALVVRDWELICIVAGELLKHGRLSGRQVTRIVKRYDTDKRAALANIPDLNGLLIARKKRLLRGRKPRRSDVARAAIEALGAKRFIQAPLYKAVADRLCAKGFGERESIEALDQIDIFPQYEIAGGFSVGQRRARLSESGPPVPRRSADA